MSVIKRAGLALTCGAFLLGTASTCLAFGKDCPPPYVHCQEKGPRIKFKCGCPRPVCPPCDSPWFGYYPTCWSPWGAGSPNCPTQNPPWVPTGNTTAQNVPPMPHVGGMPHVGSPYNGVPGGPGMMEVVPAPGVHPTPVRPQLDSDGQPGEELRAPRPLNPESAPRLRPTAVDIVPTSATSGRPRLNAVPYQR